MPDDDALRLSQPPAQLIDRRIGHGDDPSTQRGFRHAGKGTRPTAGADARGERTRGRVGPDPPGDGAFTDGNAWGDLGTGPAIRHGCQHPFTEVHRRGTGHATIIAPPVILR